MTPAGWESILHMGSCFLRSWWRWRDEQTVQYSGNRDEPLLPWRHTWPEQTEAGEAGTGGGETESTHGAPAWATFFSELGWIWCVCCRICPTGVCGVLCRQEFLVPSSGRDRQHGLGVLQSSLLPGGPWGAGFCLLRQVSTPFFCLLLALLFSAKVGSHRSCLVATHLQGLNHHHHFYIDEIKKKKKGLKFVPPSVIHLCLESVRVIQKNFLQLPFWVRKFHLARIKPTTLRVSLCEEPAKLM